MTHSSISHTYIRFFDEYINAWLIIHADLPGVIIEDAQGYDLENVVITEYEIISPREKDVLKASMKFLKKKYNWWKIAKWAWYLWRHTSKEQLSGLLPDNPQSMVCVDFATFFIKNLASRYPSIKLTPSELQQWVEDNYLEFGWKKQ